jgi:hypothetical protein
VAETDNTPPWLAGLSGEHLPKLIESDSKIVRVVAGPGSGKTTGLKRRIQRLVERDGVDPQRIFVGTFTRAIALAADFGITMPVRVYNKTGNGLGNFIDSGLVETDTASWVIAAMATEQTDYASRSDDSAPTAFGEVGERLYQAWAQS